MSAKRKPWKTGRIFTPPFFFLMHDRLSVRETTCEHSTYESLYAHVLIIFA